MKPRTCESCQTTFTPQRMGARACSPMCAIRLVKAEKKTKAQAKKAERKADVEKLAKLAPIRKLVSDAQKVFNRWIRSRDEKQPCISCGAPPPNDTYQGGRDAGHFRSTGAASHLRFNEDNCHAQCVHCNQYLSGNVLAYRVGLVGRVGLARLQALESMNEPHKWKRDELIAIKEDYAARLRAIKKA